MNKQEWISTGIKLFGIYLIVMAIVALPNAIADIWSYFSLQEMCNSQSNTIETQQSTDFENAVCFTKTSQAIKGMFSLIIYSVMGLYFIGSAKLANKVLGNETA